MPPPMIAMSEACVTAGRISARDGFDQTVVAGPWTSLLPAGFGLLVLYCLLGIGALPRRRYAGGMGCARRSYQPRGTRGPCPSAAAGKAGPGGWGGERPRYWTWAAPIYRLTIPLAGRVEDFHLQTNPPCRAHKKPQAPDDGWRLWNAEVVAVRCAGASAARWIPPSRQRSWQEARG